MQCRAKRAVLDGETVCLDRKGNSQFKNLRFRRGEPRFNAFDLLSSDGEDLRYFPLAERKHRLRGVVRHATERLLYCDPIEEYAGHLFQLACKRDLEGIVAKHKFDPYLVDSAKWYKIRNRNYSHWAEQEKLFERERSADPNCHYWNVCASASDELVEAQ